MICVNQSDLEHVVGGFSKKTKSKICKGVTASTMAVGALAGGTIGLLLCDCLEKVTNKKLGGIMTGSLVSVTALLGMMFCYVGGKCSKYLVENNK